MTGTAIAATLVTLLGRTLARGETAARAVVYVSTPCGRGRSGRRPTRACT